MISSRPQIRKQKLDRRPTLSDVMILVAVVAAALPICRFVAASQPEHYFAEPRFWLWFYVLIPGPLLLLFGALGHILLALRHPRPPIRRLARRPGFVASVAVTISWLCYESVRIPCEWSSGRGGAHVALSAFSGLIAVPVIPAAIVSCWTILYLSGLWGPRRGWLDRLGVALGLMWFVLVGALVVDVLLTWYGL
jgi:hypothetical protein